MARSGTLAPSTSTPHMAQEARSYVSAVRSKLHKDALKSHAADISADIVAGRKDIGSATVAELRDCTMPQLKSVCVREGWTGHSSYSKEQMVQFVAFGTVPPKKAKPAKAGGTVESNRALLAPFRAEVNVWAKAQYGRTLSALRADELKAAIAKFAA